MDKAAKVGVKPETHSQPYIAIEPALPCLHPVSGTDSLGSGLLEFVNLRIACTKSQPFEKINAINANVILAANNGLGARISEIIPFKETQPTTNTSFSNTDMFRTQLAGNRPRHPFLLGRTHGHDGAAAHRQSAFQTG